MLDAAVRIMWTIDRQAQLAVSLYLYHYLWHIAGTLTRRQRPRSTFHSPTSGIEERDIGSAMVLTLLSQSGSQLRMLPAVCHSPQHAVLC